MKEAFDSRNAEYIKRQIREQIRRVSVTVCLIGETTYTSKWVDWELRESAEMDKGLVGVAITRGLGFQSFPIIPLTLQLNQAEIVTWNAKNIVTAIERAGLRADLRKLLSSTRRQ